MAACNQTDIPVLNIQEDPCIHGSLVTSCIFYGLAIEYLGSQNTSSLLETIELIVAKLEEGNIEAENLEEANRAQALLIEDLQNIVAESLVTLSEVQVLLDECCPEPTTTIAPTTTTTTTISTSTTTTTSGTPTIWFGKFSETGNKFEVCFGGSWSSANVYTTISSGPFAPGTPLYTNQSLTTLFPLNGVISINNFVYTIVNGYTVGAGEPCSMTTTSTTTISPTTTTTSNPTAGSYMSEFGVGVALYNVDGSQAGKYWTIGSNYSQFTNIPTGQSLGVGTALYFDVACTEQWNFPFSVYLITGITDPYNVNPYTVIWKVDNGVVTENFGQFVNKAYYLINGTRASNELIPCNEMYPNGIYLDNGYTALMPGINVYSAQGSAVSPIQLAYNYLTDEVNVYQIVNGVLTSPQTCIGITTTTTSTTTTETPVFAWFGPTSANACDQNYYNTSIILNGGATSICDANIIYTNFTPYGVGNTTIYVKQSGSSLVRSFFVDSSGTFATQTGICQSCQTTTTSTTTTTTVAVPGSYILGTTGTSPWDIVLDAEGNVYTSNQNSNNVTKITPEGVSTVLGTTGSQPRGITIDTQGNIYVINSGDNTVTKITPSGVSTVLGSAGTGANDITVDQQGNVYVNNNGPNTVTKITPQGVSTTFASVASNPQCIATDSQGNVYTASPNVVNKITPNGVSTILGNTLDQPLSIIVDDAGNVYVSTVGNQVVKITPSGTSTSLGYVGSSPYGIALDSYGNVYTSNSGSNNVSKITPGGVITAIGTTGISPIGIVVDALGNVYTANYNSNNVTKIVQETTTTTTTVAPTTTTTTVAPGLTCPEGFPNRTTGNGTMTLSNGVTLTTTYTGPTLLSGNFNPPFTACGNSFKGNDGAGGTMYLNYTGGAFTLTLTFSQPQSHVAFGITGMGIYNQPGVTESYTFNTNGGGTQITELNGCGNFQVQGFNTLVGSNNNGTASDGSGAIQVTSSGLFTEVTITGNNSGSLNGVGIDLYLCSNLIIE